MYEYVQESFKQTKEYLEEGLKSAVYSAFGRPADAIAQYVQRNTDKDPGGIRKSIAEHTPAQDNSISAKHYTQVIGAAVGNLATISIVAGAAKLAMPGIGKLVKSESLANSMLKPTEGAGMFGLTTKQMMGTAAFNASILTPGTDNSSTGQFWTEKGLNATQQALMFGAFNSISNKPIGKITEALTGSNKFSESVILNSKLVNGSILGSGFAGLNALTDGILRDKQYCEVNHVGHAMLDGLVLGTFFGSLGTARDIGRYSTQKTVEGARYVGTLPRKAGDGFSSGIGHIQSGSASLWNNWVTQPWQNSAMRARLTSMREQLRGSGGAKEVDEAVVKAQAKPAGSDAARDKSKEPGGAGSGSKDKGGARPEKQGGGGAKNDGNGQDGDGQGAKQKKKNK